MCDSGTAAAILGRLQDSLNSRDLDGLLACFHPCVESIHPCHPDRNSAGLDALRASWGAIFSNLTEFHANLSRFVAADSSVWTEWCWHGTHHEGGAYESAGVMIFDFRDDRIERVHVYSDVITSQAPDWDNILDDLLSNEPDEDGSA